MKLCKKSLKVTKILFSFPPIVITTDNLEVKQFLVKKCIECLMADKIHHNVIQVSGWVSQCYNEFEPRCEETGLWGFCLRHIQTGLYSLRRKFES